MRSKDRLDELRHLAQQAGVYHDTVLAEPRAPLSKDIDDLLREVEPLRAWILDVERNTQLIRRLHADPTYTSNRQLQEQLDALATASHALGLKACGALRQLAARARCGAASGAASRMAHLQFAATRRLCDAALARHEHALQALRDQQHRLLHEQIKLTNLTISEEECEHLLESNNIALFVDNSSVAAARGDGGGAPGAARRGGAARRAGARRALAAERARPVPAAGAPRRRTGASPGSRRLQLHAETAEARLALRDAEARRDELARVERSLQSVRDLFLQLAHLVAAQKKMGLIICLAAGCLVVLLVLVLS
ncbi:syntaxin-11-like isoform X3 [Maniola hyperantus]|uniref:syntaxin-11-like isoform X3 n=1 Tax=Aphantopus hyperantus TaxID=2795564 RepID=UPI0037485CA2